MKISSKKSWQQSDFGKIVCPVLKRFIVICRQWWPRIWIRFEMEVVGIRMSPSLSRRWWRNSWWRWPPGNGLSNGRICTPISYEYQLHSPRLLSSHEIFLWLLKSRNAMPVCTTRIILPIGSPYFQPVFQTERNRGSVTWDHDLLAKSVFFFWSVGAMTSRGNRRPQHRARTGRLISPVSYSLTKISHYSYLQQERSSAHAVKHT